MKYYFKFLSFCTSVLLFCFLLSSCAYFNTFYNAKKYFNSAKSRALNTTGRPSAQSIEDYNKVIRKCGTILTDYKDSKWADDALFLMARALYYRMQNLILALDAFNDLIQFYPNSPFIGEAIIYTGVIHYDLNQKEEAFTILRNFIRNEEFQKDHPKALITIADLYILEKDFVEAQHYLNILTSNYPKSSQFAEAIVLLGKTYFDSENYDQSLKVFYDITTKKIPKSYHLDARYYIAYNYYHLQNYSQALNTIRTLQRQEHRLNKLAEQDILYALIIAELHRVNDAIDVLESVITNNPRSNFSAEAAYHIAEMYFRKLHDYEKAIDNFNRVRRESQQSTFADRAVTRSAVASQILQYYRQSTTWTAEQLITEQFKLAEFYLYELALPDSALFIYSKIPEQKLSIEMKLDSLRNYVLDFEIYDITAETYDIESLFAHADTLHSEGDAEITNDADVTADTELDGIKETILLFEDDLDLYLSIFVPQSYFMSMVVQKQFLEDEISALQMFVRLSEEFPDSRYTEAAREFLNDEPVTYLTTHEKFQMSKFDEAMEHYTIGEDVSDESLFKVLDILHSIKDTQHPDLIDKTLFSLGFIYFYDFADTLSAKYYFDTMLEKSPQSQYARFIQNIYDGTAFIVLDRLPSIVEAEQKLAEMNEEDIPVDSIDVSDDEFAPSLLIDYLDIFDIEKIEQDIDSHSTFIEEIDFDDGEDLDH